MKIANIAYLDRPSRGGLSLINRHTVPFVVKMQRASTWDAGDPLSLSMFPIVCAKFPHDFSSELFLLFPSCATMQQSNICSPINH